MESQNIDRRDSKKGGKNNGNKNQPRVGGNGNTTGGVGGKTSVPGGDKQKSHSQKSGKRYQEIYKPPSLRSSKNRNQCDQASPQKGNNHEDGLLLGGSSKRSNQIGLNSKSIGNMSPQPNNTDPFGGDPSGNSYSLFGNANNNPTNNGNSSVPSSPLISSRMQNSFNIGLAKRMLNVNAKEFQFLPIQQQQQQQQLSNFLSQFDPSLFYNNSPILASSGVYPLKQSKSSGNMNLLLQQAQQQQQAQAAALQQLQIAMGLNSSMQAGNYPGGASACNQFNRLTQSKSSGNVPGNGNRPRVRFDDEEIDFDDADDDFVNGQLGNYLASLKMNGDLQGLSQATNFPMGFPFQQQQPQPPNPPNVVPLSPQPVMKSSLQKSRTGFYLNLYGNQQQQQLHSQQSQQQMQLGSPTKQHYGFNTGMHPSSNSNYGGILSGGAVGGSSVTHPPFSQSTGIVKRSRSFGPGNHHTPRVSATALLSASTSHGSTTSGGHSVYSDFCISKWPRAVQELVTAAVTGVERIPARNWIEMVNGIFEAMLCDFLPNKRDKFGTDTKSCGDTAASGNTYSASSGTNNDKSSELSTAEKSSLLVGSNGKNRSADQAGENNDRNPINIEDNDEDEDDDDNDDDTDLTSAAVHIFLYFIQREKDRTVMESLLNTCFASFQRLSSASSSSSSSSGGKFIRSQKLMDQQGKPTIPRQWCNFLRFLSTLYAHVKLIRRQKQSQQQPGHSMDEMSFSLLALLCDSCLATLRSPQSYTAEMMGCLFTVLTSIGRDMEGTFPLKMKQLLAAVRDALLGIGPYHQQQQQQHHQHNNTASSLSSSSSKSSSASSLSPIVQKTLMQLIELHAANWQLPASAVRYYYSSVSNNKSMSSSSANTANSDGGGDGSSSFGNNYNQSAKSNNNGGGVTTTSQNVTASPSSTSSVTTSSNDNDETKNNGEGSTASAVSLSVKNNTNGLLLEKAGEKVESVGTANVGDEKTTDKA